MNAQPIPTITKNQLIKFGNHNWIILDVQDGRMLLLSYLVLETRHYNHYPPYVASWELSKLRKYLNREFYLLSFSCEERERIETVSLPNNENPWYRLHGNHKDTKDNIFLLSIEDVLKYFGDNLQLPSKATKNKIPLEISNECNNARVACDQYGIVSSWALRTQGAEFDKIACINGGISFGSINISGRSVRKRFGVRPALWVKLEQQKD